MKTPYEIETDQDSITIRLPRRMVEDQALIRFLDYLEMQDIRQRSQLSEEDANMLADEVNQDAWQRIRHLFEASDSD